MPSKIIISYGMPKSASTFAWMLIKQILIEAGETVATLSTDAKKNRSKEDYVSHLEPGQIEKIASEAGDGSVVVKTHAAANSFKGFAQPFECSFVFVQFRDPRDISLSLLDHGARTRARGIHDFADCVDYESTLKYIDSALERARSWMELDGAMNISYDELCFDGAKTTQRIIERLGVIVDPSEVLKKFEDKSKITQFNKGSRDRWRKEMEEAESRKFLQRYQSFYSKNMP